MQDETGIRVNSSAFKDLGMTRLSKCADAVAELGIPGAIARSQISPAWTRLTTGAPTIFVLGIPTVEQ